MYRSKRGVRFSALLVFAAGSFLPCSSLAETYTFSKLADSAGPLDGLGVPALNNNDAVAFFAFRDGGGQGIYRADGVDLTLIAETTSEGFYSFTGCGSFQLISAPDLDDAGRVVFRAYTFDPETWECPEAIYLGDGGTVVPITDIGPGGALYSDWCNPSMSGSGVVAFRGRAPVDESHSVIGLYVYDGQTRELMVDDTGNLNALGDPDVNDDGAITFHAGNLGPEGYEGIYFCSGGPPTPIAMAGTDYVFVNSEPAIAENGTVAFLAEPVYLTRAIYTWDGTTTQVADTEGPFEQFTAPAVNAAGDVAFFAEFEGWGRGIFTGPDPVADRVIATGDSLFGSVVVHLECGRHALNESGKIAFAYSLENGNSGIALASPGTTAGIGPDLASFVGGGLVLAPASPNLTRESAVLRSRVPEGWGPPRLAVYAASGRLVKELAIRATGDAEYESSWDGRDGAGRTVTSGLYLAKLVVRGDARSTRILVLR
jgi:hypothetical protein